MDVRIPASLHPLLQDLSVDLERLLQVQRENLNTYKE